MAENKDYETFCHSDPSITTVDELVNNPNSKIKGWTVGGLLCYADENGKTNLDEIYNRYNFEDVNEVSKEVFNAKVLADSKQVRLLKGDAVDSFVPAYNMLKLCTIIRVPLNRLQTDIILSKNDTVQTGKYDDIMKDLIKGLISEDNSGNSYINDTAGIRCEEYDISVWAWCKALGIDKDNPLDGKLIDLRPFITNVDTNKTFDSGSFSLTLSPIPAIMIDGKWIIGTNNINYTELSIGDKWKSGKSKRSRTYLANIISYHDVIFISYKKIGKKISNMIDFSLDNIDDASFDMIGLVDSPIESMIAGNNDITISVSGADLMRLLYDDGSGIYAQRFVAAGKFYEEADFSSGLIRYMGQYKSTFQLQDQRIRDQILFVVDYMSRAVICGELFSNIKNGRKSKITMPEASIVGRELKGIWKGIDVIVDDAVANLKSFNSNIGNAFDSLNSQLDNICVEPLVQLGGDTYGDRFYIIARRPPYDRDKILTLVSDNSIITVKEVDVLSDSLKYDTTAYTWYKMDFQYLLSVLGEDTAWLLPAIYFEEYAMIWGDKPMRVQNPYIDMLEKINKKEDRYAGSNMIKQNMLDLKYVIESHAYLPFTRTGTIFMRGTRSIKAGMWIKYEGTGEIFYVEGVNQNASISDSIINRETTLSVSRGMVLDEIDDYFNIIKLPVGDVKDSDDFARFTEETYKSWKVNTEIFNKLLRRTMQNNGGIIINNNISA